MMEAAEMIVEIAGTVAVACAIFWLLRELLVRAFASYACSVEPRGAELFAQLAFFIFQRGRPNLGLGSA
jgi:hypothetical protein